MMPMKLPLRSHLSPNQITEKYWADAATGRRKGDFPVNWLQSELVLHYCVNPRISGNPNVGWLEWVQRRFLKGPVEKGLVLGCGGGQLERKAARLGICSSFLGIDISREAVRVAETLAEREGWSDFQYRAVDANCLELEADSFDLILSDMALHHIERLEDLLHQFHKALRPEGLFILNEFVGPSRFQWSDEQLQLATQLIRSLPLHLRRNRDMTRWKRFLKPWTRKAKRWSVEKLARIDPSESVRSSEIPELIDRYFHVLERRDYGGTLLSLVLNNIVGNFRDRENDVAILMSLAAQEWSLLESKRLKSDYQLVVATKQNH